VEIGEAEGHNWWCVLFPSLCLAGETELSKTALAQGLTEEDVALLEQKEPKYVVRFRCVELWEELKEALEGQK
jgi:stage II sporulation protein R